MNPCDSSWKTSSASIFRHLFKHIEKKTSVKIAIFSNLFKHKQPQSSKQLHAGPKRFGNISGKPGWPLLLLHVFLHQQPVQNSCGRKQQWQRPFGRGVRNKSAEDWQNGCHSGHLGSTGIFDSCMDRLRAVCGFHASD